jgi:hypothetical protein
MLVERIQRKNAAPGARRRLLKQPAAAARILQFLLNP